MSAINGLVQGLIAGISLAVQQREIQHEKGNTCIKQLRQNTCIKHLRQNFKNALVQQEALYQETYTPHSNHNSIAIARLYKRLH